MAINYKKTAWNDNASGYTPITPARLNNIENALKSVCDGWDSVSQRLWAGTLRQNGSVTINGLSSCKLIGLEFSDSAGHMAPVRVASGNREFSLLQVPVDSANWVVRYYFGRVNISGNALKLLKCGIGEASSPGLGSAFTLTGGDIRAVTAVWRIL